MPHWSKTPVIEQFAAAVAVDAAPWMAQSVQLRQTLYGVGGFELVQFGPQLCTDTTHQARQKHPAQTLQLREKEGRQAGRQVAATRSMAGATHQPGLHCDAIAAEQLEATGAAQACCISSRVQDCI
jgi:hypothetical protein